MFWRFEIAELTGKQHKNLMRDIRNMEPAWVKIAGLKFELGSYEDANGQMRPCYFLTKTECLYIATKFNDEARARLVLRQQLAAAYPDADPNDIEVELALSLSEK